MNAFIFISQNNTPKNMQVLNNESQTTQIKLLEVYRIGFLFIHNIETFSEKIRINPISTTDQTQRLHKVATGLLENIHKESYPSLWSLCDALTRDLGNPATITEIKYYTHYIEASNHIGLLNEYMSFVKNMNSLFYEYNIHFITQMITEINELKNNISVMQTEIMQLKNKNM